jgi:transcription antitermination factor NusG
MMGNSATEIIPRWFALAVKPQHEKAVAAALQAKRLEGFLPLYRTRHKWSDRIKELKLPLFAGYVFCRFHAGQKAAVLSTPGVRSIVSFGHKPVPLENSEIEAILSMIASGLPVGPWPFLSVGQRVRIESGPLRGVEGILVQVKDTWRVVVSVALLQRSVAVELDRCQLSAIHPRAQATCRALEFSAI